MKHTCRYLRCFLTVSCLSLLLLSCGDDDEKPTPVPEPDPTPEVPTQGTFRTTADWSTCPDASILPDTYTLYIGEKSQSLKKEDSYLYPTLLDPGKYTLLAYNHAEQISVSGTTATIETIEDGTLAPLPGYLFSAMQQVDIIAGDTLNTTLKMRQHIRQLTLKLKLAEEDAGRISGTTATLSGIASAFSLENGAVISTSGKTTAPIFIIVHGDEGRAAGDTYLCATVRIAGTVTEEKQQLTLFITFAEGNRQLVETDMTEAIKDFNEGTVPIELEANLTLPVQPGITATIGGWSKMDEQIDIEQ
ncbi:FimB/Mfa2 family fimbrial subunit [Phocaeicola sp.]